MIFKIEFLFIILFGEVLRILELFSYNLVFCIVFVVKLVNVLIVFVLLFIFYCIVLIFDMLYFLRSCLRSEGVIFLVCRTDLKLFVVSRFFFVRC